jgi:hypothetical protein
MGFLQNYKPPRTGSRLISRINVVKLIVPALIDHLFYPKCPVSVMLSLQTRIELDAGSAVLSNEFLKAGTQRGKRHDQEQLQLLLLPATKRECTSRA